MKRKAFLATLTLTALLLGGCTQNNTHSDTAPNPSQSAASEADAHSGAVQNNTHSGTTQSDNEQADMITEENAKEIALTHAGLTADQVTFIKSGLDRDDGRENYDVEFYTNDQKEYDYKIDPYTGNVLDYDYDAEYYGNSTISSQSEGISEDDVKKIVLNKVPGATAEDIREFGADYENGKLQYEGKIFYDKKEYEFEIDGNDGSILEWDVENIDN